MSHRFSYVKYNERAQMVQEEFKKRFEDLEAFAETSLGTSRYKSLFLTALEEAYMWTGKSIRDEQMLPMTEEEKKADHVPGRTDK